MKDNMRFVTKGLSGLQFLRPETHASACKRYFGTCLIVMLLVVIMAGCNGNDPSLGGGGTTGPTVNSTVPANGASGVAIDSTISATFGTAMAPATIESPATNFTVATGGTSITGTVALSADGLTATFTPDADLTADKVYTATITTAVKDLAGNAMAADKVWTFSTGTGSTPTVTVVTPADGAIDVLTNAPITATFSAEMDPATIISPATTFTLTTGAAGVLGTVNYNATTRVATFIPTGGVLAVSTPYTARVTTGAKDVFGNAVVPETWSFTTGLL